MFTTLDDLKKGSKKEEEKKGKKTSSYTGGSKSGMEVENPVDDIVRQAKEQSSSGEVGKEGTKLKITLWKNGFQVDEGEFRPYDDPRNQQFMKELKDGFVPSEIRAKHKGKEPMDVGLDDKREEEFVPPPPPAYVAYSGSGITMGGVSGVGLGVDKDNGKPIIDDSKPKTKIAFRFHNGERAVVEFNTNHTIADIHMYVMMAAPVDGSYQLIEGFPPKPIPEEDGLTIEKANLCSGSITQKII